MKKERPDYSDEAVMAATRLLRRKAANEMMKEITGGAGHGDAQKEKNDAIQGIKGDQLHRL
jgi:hypothetical protein